MTTPADPSARSEPTPLTRSASLLLWLTLLACVGGLLLYWTTGFLDPETGSGTGERLFLTLSPALVVALVARLVLRGAPSARAVVQLLVLAVGWGLFVATR